MAEATQASFEIFERFDPGPLFEETSSDGDVEMTMEEAPSRLIIAFDFGTTFSSVAYVQISEAIQRKALNLVDVRCIARYPDDRPGPQVTVAWESRQDVPTELWYPHRPLSNQRQGGEIRIRPTEDESENEHSVDSDSSSELGLELSEGENEAENELDLREEEWGRSDHLFWGFGVQKQLKKIDIPKDGTRRVNRFKLMLDEKNDQASHIRTEIGTIVKNLKRSKLIEKETDIISDYLEQLLTHTRNELQMWNDFNGNIPIEFVLCVPAVWPSKACRIMQAAMAAAAQRSGLGSLKNDSLCNLFIISEPEAAAACVLAEDNNDIYVGETIVILDAGGGTVDAVTYQVTNSYPPRLSSEVVEPGSQLCGASYINERLEKLLLKKLKHEDYLVKSGKTIKSIVEGKVTEFENGEKRIIDVTDKHWEMEPIWIDDLRLNPKKRFYQNRLEISRKEMTWLFQTSLDGATAVLREQLEMAKAKEYSVQKVLLIGGFGQSPSLQSRLRSVVASETNFQGRHIDFLIPHTPSTVVARGAVLRAYNKDLGPTRTTLCSYGFLRTEPYEPRINAAHKNTKCVIDKADGERYVDSTIDWLIKKGAHLPTVKELPITVKHTFPLNRQKFICKEELYVSDNLHESHYRKTHAMNKGAELAGSIIVDMTFLKTKGLIKPEPPSIYSTYSRSKDLHWAVTFQLVMIVDGRNLRYEARWPPPEKDGEAAPEHQAVHARSQTCIAAAFKPGTA